MRDHSKLNRRNLFFRFFLISMLLLFIASVAFATIINIRADHLINQVEELNSETTSERENSSEAASSSLIIEGINNFRQQIYLLLTVFLIFGQGLLTYLVNRGISARLKAEKDLVAANNQLEKSLAALEVRSHEMSVLGEISDLLQACLSNEEAYDVIALHVPKLFPENPGYLYTLKNTKTVLESVSSWGNPVEGQSKALFSKEECWALRRGNLHHLQNNNAGPHCAHVNVDAKTQYMCVPLAAQSEMFGILHFQDPKGTLTESEEVHALTLAENISVYMANLTLRETLQSQVMRDSLTGLPNRRYLEESLEREILRSQRSKLPIGLLIIDIDHFKYYNDRFGHHGGDRLLQELGAFLRTNIRGGDIACRYGGEEFILVLLETQQSGAIKRAETLREGVKNINVLQQREPLGAITISIGVAMYPEHAVTAESLVNAADAALYKAKASGRDCVVLFKTAGKRVSPKD